MLTEQRVSLFHNLGSFFSFLIGKNSNDKQNEHFKPLKTKAFSVFDKAEQENPWFTKENILYQIETWSDLLTKEKLSNWILKYENSNQNKRIGIVMAGNIPMVGFHDFLAVLLSGNIAVVKASSKDIALFEWYKNLLIYFDDEIAELIKVEDRLTNLDAVIATGSNNTARYFEYYFREIPYVIRKNRTSVAVLTGEETKEELTALGNDVFRYFGLGCRNVTQLLIPKEFNLNLLFEAFQSYQNVINHNKYANNYTYHKAIYLMNQDAFLDNNFLLLKESKNLFSPISTLFYHRYTNQEEVTHFLSENANQIQCTVSNYYDTEKSIRMGKAQQPTLSDNADGVDTLRFLNELA